MYTKNSHGFTSELSVLDFTILQVKFSIKNDLIQK